ncbi:M14 family zinc carboxypeptidase, partial [Patescibacteria group bacterium]
VVIAGAAYFLIQNKVGSDLAAVEQASLEVDESDVDVSEEVYSHEVIGASVDGRDIEAYRFGAGENKLVYIGALHGGYEWNSALLSYELIDYLTENSSAVPADIEVVVIPVANPDGLYKVVGTSTRFSAIDAPQFDFASEISLKDVVASGRFNANDVDLNRNFDCKWKADAVWRDYSVSAGTEAFSEPTLF